MPDVRQRRDGKREQRGDAEAEQEADAADDELGGRAVGCGGLYPAEGSDDGAVDDRGDQPAGGCTAEHHTGPDEITGRGRMIGIREVRVVRRSGLRRALRAGRRPCG